MTFQKTLLYFVAGIFLFGFYSHLINSDCKDNITSRVASVPATTQPTISTTIPAAHDTTSVKEQIYRKISGKINPGDTLSKSLYRSNIPVSIHAEIIKSLQQSLDLRSLRPGDTFIAGLGPDNNLVKFTYIRSPVESYTTSCKKGAYLCCRDDVELKVETVFIKGKIKKSLFNVFLRQGESGKLVHAFADIFSARIDFNTECRKGDQIKAVFEKNFKDGKFVGYGKILYAEYKKQSGADFEGFYYSSANTKGAFFAGDGRELGSFFIKSPVPLGRLTSGFTWHRKHPILGVVRPHLGIDLAAPIGTPIMAAGDGKVIFAGHRGGFGRQIILAHANGYKTYYGHLSRFRKGLKKGTVVKQKEIIGYVGSSGMSTGSHLDYRISLNGVYLNPLTIKFKSKSFLKGTELAAFQQQKDKFKEKINCLKPHKIVAVRHIVLNSKDDGIKIL